MATATTILTSDFFTKFALKYPGNTIHDYMPNVITRNAEAIAAYCALTYGSLPFWDELDTMSEQEVVDIAFAVLGENVMRIYNALMAEYDPLENYFVEREMGTDTEGSVTKTGNKTKNPTGSISATTGGTKTTNYNNQGNIGQSTTFEEFGDNDFRNVNKTIATGSISVGFNGYGTTTSYNNYSETEQYNNIKDETDMSETIRESRHGNSGIFRKQELTDAEITLRIRHKFIPILCRLIVDIFNTGVYYADT